MATIEELKAQALEVFHADRPGENTAARVGGHLVECVDEEVRHREAVQVVLDELERAVAAAQGVIESLTMADGEMLRRLQGVSAVSSAMTDPLLNAGNLRTDAALNEYMAAMKCTGTVRANVEGKEVGNHQYVSSWGVFYTQTVEGNIRLQSDGQIYTVQGEFRKLSRRVSVVGGVLTPSAWVEVCSPSLAGLASVAAAATPLVRHLGDFASLEAALAVVGESADNAAFVAEVRRSAALLTCSVTGGTHSGAGGVIINTRLEGADNSGSQAAGSMGKFGQYIFFGGRTLARRIDLRRDGTGAYVSVIGENAGLDCYPLMDRYHAGNDLRLGLTNFVRSGWLVAEGNPNYVQIPVATAEKAGLLSVELFAKLSGMGVKHLGDFASYSAELEAATQAVENVTGFHVLTFRITATDTPGMGTIVSTRDSRQGHEREALQWRFYDCSFKVRRLSWTAEGVVTAGAWQQHTDITTSNFTATEIRLNLRDKAYGNNFSYVALPSATTAKAGLMSAEDKAEMETIAANYHSLEQRVLALERQINGGS